MSRILILTHEFLPFRGGISAVADGLARGAAAIGHEPTVFAPDYHTKSRLAPIDEYGVVRFRGETCRMARPTQLLRFAVTCNTIIRRMKPDVLHAADPPSQMALTLLHRLRLVDEYYFTLHGSELLRYRSERVPRVWMAGAFQRVSGVAAVSEAALDLAQRLGLPEDRSVIAYPAIADAWHETPIGDRSAIRLSWGASKDDVVLLTLSRLTRDKGHSDVIDALGQLPHEERRRFLYVIAGAGKTSYLRSLEERAARANVRLRYLGQIDDADAAHAADASDVFVMVSRRTHKRLEGFGIAYIEAASRGLPAIARWTGGTAEAVCNGVTGLVLPEDASPAALMQALKHLSHDGDARKRLGTAAKARARAFTWQAHARRVYDAFASMPRRVRRSA